MAFRTGFSFNSLARAFDAARDVVKARASVVGLEFLGLGAAAQQDPPRAVPIHCASHGGSATTSGSANIAAAAAAAADTNAAANVDDDDDDDVRGGSNYKGWLKTPGHKWLDRRWRELYSDSAPTQAGAVAEGEYRCVFSHYFDCTPGPSRAYYFESWPRGAAEPVFLLIHIHYWDKPARDEPGLPKHVNVRRAWQINPDELRLRSDGLTQALVPPPAGMSRGDQNLWVRYTSPLVWDLNKNRDEERARAARALQHMLGSLCFCPFASLWNEMKGMCVTGGPLKVMDKHSMDRNGWDFSDGSQPYVKPRPMLACLLCAFGQLEYRRLFTTKGFHCP
jgi:hypothetical protein